LLLLLTMMLACSTGPSTARWDYEKAKASEPGPDAGGAGEDGTAEPLWFVEGKPSALSVLPLARIEAVEVAGGKGYFRLAGSSAEFVPRGNNYIRLNKSDGGHHATFMPSSYDHTAVEHALGQMASHGYNVVRVFIDPGGWERPSGINGPWQTKSLDPAYMDAVADFVKTATRKGIYVMPVLDLFPFNEHYIGIAQPFDPDLVSINAYTLHMGHIQAKAAYLKDFINALSSRVGKPLLSTIFAYSLDNELYYTGRHKPFSSTTVSVTTADGNTYSMASAAERQQAADANTVLYAQLTSAAVKQVDPAALVTTGMYTFAAVGRDGPNGLLPVPGAGQEDRFPVRPRQLAAFAGLSFLDVHAYPFPAPYTLEQDLASSEWSHVDRSRPVIMGEMGAFKFAYPSLADAAVAMVAHQVDSCQYGLSGWLFWTYDSVEQPELWNLLDDSADDPPIEGAINRVLAPLMRPDPCASAGPIGQGV